MKFLIRVIITGKFSGVWDILFDIVNKVFSPVIHNMIKLFLADDVKEY